MLTSHWEQDALRIASTFMSFGGKLGKVQVTSVWKKKSTSRLLFFSFVEQTGQPSFLFCFFFNMGLTLGIRSPTEYCDFASVCIL